MGQTAHSFQALAGMALSNVSKSSNGLNVFLALQPHFLLTACSAGTTADSDAADPKMLGMC